MNQDGLAGQKLGVVEQHVLDGGERDRRAGGIAQRDAGRHRDDEARRQIDELAGIAVEVKAHRAFDVLAKIVAAFAAGTALAAGRAAIHHNRVARPKA